MTSDEARAIAQALAVSASDRGKGAHVEPRHFERPMRLSTTELELLRERLKKATRDVARELAPVMRLAPKVDVLEVAEVNADALPVELQAPFAVLRFEVDKQPGWMVWDCAAALNTMDVALGAATAGESQPRIFTPIERSVFVRVSVAALTCFAKALGQSVANPTLAQELETLGGWRQGGERAEAQRLRATIELDAPGGRTRWRLYLPGIVAAAKAAPKAERPAPLPAHLNDVRVDVCAHLGANDVPLADLLALEVGDVIPLCIERGQTLRVLIEDQACLRAELGRSQDKLAVRITQVERQKSEG